MHIVDIPTSMSVKWESDSEFPPSQISSATHTGDNEFELYTECHLDRWESWKVRVHEGGVRVISREGLTVGQ